MLALACIFVSPSATPGIRPSALREVWCEETMWLTWWISPSPCSDEFDKMTTFENILWYKFMSIHVCDHDIHWVNDLYIFSVFIKHYNWNPFAVFSSQQPFPTKWANNLISLANGWRFHPRYRESILLGSTSLTRQELRKLTKALKKDRATSRMIWQDVVCFFLAVLTGRMFFLFEVNSMKHGKVGW